MPEELIYKNYFEKEIESLRLDREALRRLCFILHEKSNQAAEIEVNELEKSADHTDEQFEEAKAELRRAFELDIKIRGKKGDDLFGKVDEVFESENFPSEIETIYISSENTLKANYNYIPRNRFELVLIFRKPKIFDFTISPSDPTPNRSKFIVEGQNTTWVNGVYREVDEFFKSNKSRFNFIHKQSIYDIFIWSIGIPFCFWLVMKSSGLLEYLLDDFHPIVLGGSYVYVFFFGLIGLRIIFHYARWIWPLLEYEEENSTESRHRFIISGLVFAILGTFLYDLLKVIFV